MGYSFRLAARVLLYAPFHKQDSTYHGLCYTSRGALAGISVKVPNNLSLFVDGMTNQKTGTTVQNNKRKGNEAKGKDEEAKDGTRKEKSDNAEKKGGNLKENITGNNHTENGCQYFLL